MLRRIRPASALVAAMTLLLAGCAATAGSGAAGPAASGTGQAASASGGHDHSTSPGGEPVRVVTSTNVWGDIASTIGGDRVRVDSFISGPEQDPHSFEASPRAELAIAGADVIIENGGGYDDFMDTLIDAARPSAPVINAVTASGVVAPAGGELNEHVWYDFPGVGEVARRIADRLAEADPAGTAAFHRNLARFERQLTALESGVAAIKAAHGGEQVAITEPVPLYLLQSAGLHNVTPPEFSEAVEEGNDVPARVLVHTLELFTTPAPGPPGARVAALVYNSQTIGPQTDRVVQAAKDGGVPTVPVTETLPAGEHYAGWMRSNVHALKVALDGDA